ncbi:lytic transglycosylase domain-containing protein [Salibacterium salarium]|uniref:Lytic transglycosylase domain-containing protein n=2 Tax=Salibacterium salarium TaxID=284579 RepID=A0A428MXW1_9BACI|nr:lytic transglycosylase domain-containing protein [Salibacterium salarium]
MLLLVGFDKSHMEELESKSKELEEAQDFEDNIEFLQRSEDIEWDIGYHEWADARQEAKALKEESDGRFSLDWGTYMVHQAKKKDIRPALVYELLKVETGGKFDPDLTGPQTKYGHAYGLAQFMKNTGPWIADLAGLPYSHSMLFDPYYSIQLSIEYLDHLHDKYEDWDQALTAYHRGVSGLETYEEEHGDAKSWYAVEIQEKAADKQDLLAKQ